MKIIKNTQLLKNRVLTCSFIDIDYETYLVKDYLLVSPNNLNTDTCLPTGIAVLAVYQNKVYVQYIKRPGYLNNDQAYIEIPRGFVDTNESEVDAAIREFKEESSFDSLSVSKSSKICDVSPEPGVIKGINRIIKLELDNISYTTCKSTCSEGIVHGCFIDLTPAWLEQVLASGELTDAISIIALQTHLISCSCPNH